jgi:hypothetical protein
LPRAEPLMMRTLFSSSAARHKLAEVAEIPEKN